MSLFFNGLGGVVANKWDALRGSYWFIPSLMVILAALVAVGLIEVDRHMVGPEMIRLPWIHDTGAEGTRALLSTVAGSMITVTGVVFSITIVALTLASSQFGPRLLRGFLRDRSTQWVLGTFVSTFLYSLLVLRAVEADRVPYLATTVALGLAVASVFVLIFFVHHSASSIQASSVIAGVVAEIEGELPVLFPESLGEPGESADQRRTTRPALSDCREARARSSGYVRVLDTESVFAISRDDDLVIELLARPGDFITEGQAIARIWPAERDPGRVREDAWPGRPSGRRRGRAERKDRPVHRRGFRGRRPPDGRPGPGIPDRSTGRNGRSRPVPRHQRSQYRRGLCEPVGGRDRAGREPRHARRRAPGRGRPAACDRPRDPVLRHRRELSWIRSVGTGSTTPRWRPRCWACSERLLDLPRSQPARAAARPCARVVRWIHPSGEGLEA